MNKFGLLIGLLVLNFFAIASVQKNKGKSYDELVRELEGIKDSSSDLEFYSEIISDYQSGKYRSLVVRLRGFSRKFPKSPFLDNAYYLAGKLALEENNFKDAVLYFQKVISQFPLSNKVASAKFGKAMAYRRMNLNAQARNVFLDIQKFHKAAPESFRAETELKLIK